MKKLIVLVGSILLVGCSIPLCYQTVQNLIGCQNQQYGIKILGTVEVQMSVEQKCCLEDNLLKKLISNYK